MRRAKEIEPRRSARGWLSRTTRRARSWCAPEGSLVESDLSGASASSAAIGAPREGYGYAIRYLCGRAEPEVDRPKTTRTARPSILRQRRWSGTGGCGEARCARPNPRTTGATGARGLDPHRDTADRAEGAARSSCGDDGLRAATTWMVALQLAAGEVLGVDSREVSGPLSEADGGELRL